VYRGRTAMRDAGGGNNNSGPSKEVSQPLFPLSCPSFLLPAFLRWVPSIPAQYNYISKIPVPVTAIMDGYVPQRVTSSTFNFEGLCECLRARVLPLVDYHRLRSVFFVSSYLYDLSFFFIPLEYCASYNSICLYVWSGLSLIH